MIYIAFLLNTFLFTWYSYKLIKDVSGVDQYWHVPQTYFLAAMFLMPLLVAKDRLVYLIQVVLYSLCYPFLFNTGLNLYRGLSINHLGKYDFLSFSQTVGLFLLGAIALILFEILFKDKLKGSK